MIEDAIAHERRALALANEALRPSEDADAREEARAREEALAEARRSVSRARELVNELRELGDDADEGERRAFIARAVAERESALENVKAIMRHAALERAAGERRREAEARDALLAGVGTSELERIKASGAVAIASEATEGLRRARQMMATELEKGEKTLAALAESTATMERTGVEYTNQGAKLKVGKQLITTIERQTIMDWVILWVGFAFFLLVVVHILWKRTPVLARFHPLYRSKIKALESIVDVVDTSSASSSQPLDVAFGGSEPALEVSKDVPLDFEEEGNPYEITVDAQPEASAPREEL